MKLSYYIRRYIAISRGYRWRLAVNTILGLASVGITLYFVWTSKRLIDIASGYAEGSIAQGAVIMACCMASQIAIGAYRNRQSTMIEIAMRNTLIRSLFASQMNSCLLEREKIHSGDVINRLDNDVTIVTDSACNVAPGVLITVAQLVSALCLLAYINLSLALVLAIIMPVAVLSSKAYMRRLRNISKEIREQDSRIQTHLQESLQHRTVINALEYTDRSTTNLTELQESLRAQIRRRQNITLFSRTLIQSGFAIGYITAFMWGIYGISTHTLTFGAMAAFLQLVGQVQRPVVDLSRQLPTFVRVLTSVERIVELEQIPTEQQGEPVKLTGLVGVKVDNACFSYPGADHDVISHLSHDFKPGSLTAIVGETGAGKSTLFKLILNLISPKSGTVEIYNHESSIPASPQSRCNIIYVPQGNTLLKGTIRENLLIGNPDATDEQINAALHTAVADFVHDLPNGIDTDCTEQGGGVSEGQAQRIAIARGLLRNGGVMLLDEPSSSLDPATEQTLLERLSSQVSGKTVILITHREAIAQMCNNTLRI